MLRHVLIKRLAYAAGGAVIVLAAATGALSGHSMVRLLSVAAQTRDHPPLHSGTALTTSESPEPEPAQSPEPKTPASPRPDTAESPRPEPSESPAGGEDPDTFSEPSDGEPTPEPGATPQSRDGSSGPGEGGGSGD